MPSGKKRRNSKLALLTLLSETQASLFELLHLLFAVKLV